MCSYCGCQSLTVIRLLTLQHEEMINVLGQVRRAIESGASGEITEHVHQLAALLEAHNRLEEEGLFTALMPDQEFTETLAKSHSEHAHIDDLVARISRGEVEVIGELETILRNNFSNEENGLFPATAVTLDGAVWDAIEREQGLS